jgi:hypothetical protein
VCALKQKKSKKPKTQKQTKILNVFGFESAQVLQVLRNEWGVYFIWFAV